MTDKCEFIPDEELEKVFEFNMRASAYVYNKTLEFSIYRSNLVNEFAIGNKFKVNRSYTQDIVKTLKKQKPFLKKAESTCLQASTDRLIKAYEGYYNKKTGFPKFKSSKRNPVNSITLRNNNYKTKEGIKETLRWEKDKFRLNKIGYIKVKHKRNINGKIKEATIKKENGRWYVCIAYQLDKINPREEFPHGHYLGIDLGLTDFLTFSNGRVITKPDLKRINERIKYYTQKIARKKEGGSNWKKTLKKIHKWINKKNNVVNDYYHKISYNIVKHYRFIAMEKLNIRGMLKSNLSRSVHEIGWGKLVEMIKYKAKWYGREFIQIDRWFPSSKKCWVCGEINSELERGEREWECPYCHTHLLRDLNAALNILYEGIRAAGSSVLSLVDFMHMLSQECLEIFLSNCEVRTICVA
ncbi:RNA-guided endonuclease InsQ/TnpB family protein [Methanobrevibacter sp.]|uniref:RNA-guided endonuclease InsQ/TnpB family protein n=1 Tax=Methanobrevibacter sp. TaxID=66852 RepID=UPI0025DD3AC7|nr:transposase [Methanobrevibacter sp.]MEE0024963.1 transposase [Methanobrevibacter sp.]